MFVDKVDEKEIEIQHLQIDEKNLAKCISILNAQRDLKMADAQQWKQKEKEVNELARLKCLFIQDLTKKCSEVNNSFK